MEFSSVGSERPMSNGPSMVAPIVKASWHARWRRGEDRRARRGVLRNKQALFDVSMDI
jgi:hypothetical protein